MTGNGATWNFTYDAEGMRTRRTGAGKDYSYTYSGGSLVHLDANGDILSFTYDTSGSPQTVTYNGTQYYYVTNLQGDVIGIVNGSGTSVVTYAYDAWGNPLSTSGTMASTLGTLNPLRYRGYVYDTETGLYYLQSRYYNPTTGRFINADALASTGQGLLGNNMFVYCENNPVMGYDPSGLINWGGFFTGLILGVAAIAVTVATFGTASPLLAIGGLAVGGVLTEAAVVTTVGAIEESTVVYDVSITAGYDRAGYSLVYDFATDTPDLYAHTGVQNKYEYAVAFGSGFVYNYTGPGSYSGEFVDISASASYKGCNLGVDFYTDPKNLNIGSPRQKGTSAFLLTTGISVPVDLQKGPTVAYDYYWKLAG